MSIVIQIKLGISDILSLINQTYGKDFTFVINKKEFKVNRIIADLVSPYINNIHLNDPLIDKLVINTKNKGDFSHFLNLLNFQRNEIPHDQLKFIHEVCKFLKIDSIELIKNENPPKITMENVFSLILEHEIVQEFYAETFSEEIDFLSTNFYQLNYHQKKEMMKLDVDTLYRIFNNENLQVNSEDDLLNFINELYKKKDKDNIYATLYETVEFDNVSQQSISKFIEVFDIFGITRITWSRICSRLLKKVIASESDGKHGKNFFYHEGSDFSGILNYLQNNPKSKTEEAVDIFSSDPKSNQEYHQAKNVMLFNDNDNFFYARNQTGNWISFDFKDYMVIPTAYTIKSVKWGKEGPYLKSWKIEGSVDNKSWEKIDEVKDSPLLNGSNAFHTFLIDCKSHNKYRYLKLTSTGENWKNNNELSIDSIEIYGKLYQ